MVLPRREWRWELFMIGSGPRHLNQALCARWSGEYGFVWRAATGIHILHFEGCVCACGSRVIEDVASTPKIRSPSLRALKKK